MLLEVLLFCTLVLQGYNNNVQIRNRNIYYYAGGGAYEVFGLSTEGTECGTGVTITMVDHEPTEQGFLRRKVKVVPWRPNIICTIGERGTFELTLLNVTDLREHSASSQFLILPHHKSKEAPILSCWTGDGGLELKPGVKKNDQWCCGLGLQGRCSRVLYRDPTNAVQCINSTITTGYGFTVQYRVKMWPRDDIKTRFRCGGFQCKNCNFTRPDNRTEEWTQLITVPYLTADFQNASLCTATFYYNSFEVASTNTSLKLEDSPIKVSSLSTTGYVLYKIDNPVCLGDGWPVPVSNWYNFKDNTVSVGSTVNRRVLLKPGKQRMCVIARGNEKIQRIMIPVKVTDYSKVYNDNSHMFYEEGATSSCTVRGDWIPSLAGGEGYTYTFIWTINGSQLNSTLTHKGDVRRWGVSIPGVGVYKCTVILRYNTTMSYGVVEPFTMTALTNVTPVPPWNLSITQPSPTQEVSSSHIDPLYVGLIIAISLIVLIIALVAFTVIRRNQTKVDQLDVKFALVEVKKKMGVNTLYSQRDEESAQGLQDIDTIVRQIENRNLEFQQLIGQGQFGKVIKAKLWSYEIEGSEMEVAVKTLTQSTISSQEDFLKEVTTMYMFDHVNVLKLLGICTDNTPFLIITEYMCNGDLKEYLMMDHVKLNMKDKISICHQVASGLEHISSHKIVHRDVAARNCLVGDDLIIKVADFGLSRNVASSEYYQKEGGQVPIRWMAPEAIKFGRYTTENDIWAFGVLMWEVFTNGEFPYSVYSNEDVLTNVINGLRLPKPAYCSEDITILMNSCWQADQLDRPTFLHLTSQLSVMLRNERNSWLLSLSDTVSTPTDGCEAECLQVNCNDENTPFIARNNKYVTEPQILCETSL